jgi:uncharacterized protein (DUF362 family)
LKRNPFENKLTRRDFLKWTGKGILLSTMNPLGRNLSADTLVSNDLFWVKDIPHHPFIGKLGPNSHAGVDCLLDVMGEKGLPFYRSNQWSLLSGPQGMIGPEDVVLVKVNAQWKYRGCTNSDLVRGLIQRILDHPDGFTGEVVIVENGQGRGSLNCDTLGGIKNPYPDSSVHANAEDESHSFVYLVDNVFNDPRVSSYLLDTIQYVFIDNSDHVTDGYRIYQDVSYPCFTTSGGRRVELREGVWNGNGYDDKIKLINVPVLKHHDRNGSEITASIKHFYGVLSMRDGHGKYRHYSGLGKTCGKMIASIKSPVLNILDCIWVSHRSLKGHPSDMTVRVDQILASQDPVALDYWAAKYIFYPIDGNERHHPDFPGIDYWLSEARDMINMSGGLYDPENGIFVTKTTKNEQEMNVHEGNAPQFVRQKLEEIVQEKRRNRPRIIK